MGPSVTAKLYQYRDNEKRNDVCELNHAYTEAQSGTPSSIPPNWTL